MLHYDQYVRLDHYSTRLDFNCPYGRNSASWRHIDSVKRGIGMRRHAASPVRPDMTSSLDDDGSFDPDYECFFVSEDVSVLDGCTQLVETQIPGCCACGTVGVSLDLCVGRSLQETHEE